MHDFINGTRAIPKGTSKCKRGIFSQAETTCDIYGVNYRLAFFTCAQHFYSCKAGNVYSWLQNGFVRQSVYSSNWQDQELYLNQIILHNQMYAA